MVLNGNHGEYGNCVKLWECGNCGRMTNTVQWQYMVSHGKCGNRGKMPGRGTRGGTITFVKLK
jgi:hypothetical protein